MDQRCALRGTSRHKYTVRTSAASARSMRQRWWMLCRRTLCWHELCLAAVSASRAVHRRAASTAIPSTNAKALLDHCRFRTISVTNICPITCPNQDADAETHAKSNQCANCHTNDVSYRGADCTPNKEPNACTNQVSDDAPHPSTNADSNSIANTVANIETDVSTDPSSPNASADSITNTDNTLQPRPVPFAGSKGSTVTLWRVSTRHFQYAHAQLECNFGVPTVLARTIRHRWQR